MAASDFCWEKSFSVIYASNEIFVVNKPFDVAMDTPQKGSDESTGAATAPPSDALTVERWAYQYIRAREAQQAAAAAVATEEQNNSTNTDNRPSPPPQHQKRPFKIIHQLDYATSGVLLFAFYNKKKAAVLASLFERRLAKKMYVAYVVGHIHLAQFPRKEAGERDTDHHAAEGRDDRGEMDMPTRLMLRSCQRGAFVETIKDNEKEEALFSPSSHENGEEKKERHIEGDMTVYRYADTVEGLRSVRRFTGPRQERLQICLPIGHALPVPRDHAGKEEEETKEKKEEASYFQMQIDGRDPKAALTYLYVLEEGYLPWTAPPADPAGPATTVHLPVTKVALRPCTGRRHQLRLHCQCIGHPILGDVAYYHTDSRINRTPLLSSPDVAASSTATAAQNDIHCYSPSFRLEGSCGRTEKPCAARAERTSSSFPYTAAMAEQQRRMYLHAQCLALPLSVEALDRAGAPNHDNNHNSNREAGASKSNSNFSFKDDAKRRRRIKIGMEKDDVAEELNVWTVFSAADDFELLLSLQ